MTINEIIITGGDTINITPTFPATFCYRITNTGTITLAAGLEFKLNTSYTPVKFDSYLFIWDATIDLAAQICTFFGSLLTKEQCIGKGFIFVQYNGSSWDVKFFKSDVLKATGIGLAAREEVAAAGGTKYLSAQGISTLSLYGANTLSSSLTVAPDPAVTPVLGDMLIVSYNATTTVGVNNVTLLGKQLSAAQALAGNCIAISIFDGTDWNTVLLTPVSIIWESGSGNNSAQLATSGCDASGDYSVAEGYYTKAAGDNSHAEGWDTEANGNHSHAEGGQNTKANGSSSHAEGAGTIADGEYSHSEGNGAWAKGDNSHAEGGLTVAKGDNSHAEGYLSVSSIINSSAHAGGVFTKAGDSQKIKVDLRKATTDETPAVMLLSDGDEIVIPTDCTIGITAEVVAVQRDGVGGTIGDSFFEIIKFAVKNVGGVSVIVPTAAVTLANYDVEVGDVIYEIPFKDAAFGGSVEITVAANTIHFTVTGESTKSIYWYAYVNMTWIGHGAFNVVV